MMSSCSSFDTGALEKFRYAALVALVFLSYLATALWGLSLHPLGGFATLVWPPTGIAIAALYFSRYRLWPAVALGAFAANVLTGAPAWVAGGIALGNTLEAVFAVYLLRDPGAFDPLLRKLSHGIRFIAVSALAPVVSAGIGCAALLAGGIITRADLPPTAAAWWIGDFLGALVVGGFLLVWIAKPASRSTGEQLLELTAAFLLLAFCAFFAVLDPLPALNAVPLIYFFVPLLWLSIRGGARSVTLGTLAIAGFLVWSAIRDVGPFAATPIPERLFLTQLLLVLFAVTELVIVAVVEEQRQTAGALAENIGQLERALARLRREAQAKNEFLAILAHELRNPLSPIVSSLELLSATEQGGALRATIETMAASAQTMRRLLDDLLDLSRISRRGFKIQKERIDLCAIVRSAASGIRPLAAASGHTLRLLAPERGLWAEADPLRIEQALTNLLNNAVRYSPKPGTITLNLRREDDDAVVEVADQGVGIAPERLPHIFEPFQKSRRPGETSGLGVGLSLSRRLLLRHGGSLEAASEGPGRGSTFTMRLPLVEPEQLDAPLAAAPPPPAAAPPAALNILIVDDNRDAARTLEALLARRGHRIATAGSGTEALQKASKRAPDAVIVDIGLPDTDGYALARDLLASGWRGTLVALTGFGQPEDRARALDAGFHRHLVKPASLADIETALASARPQLKSAQAVR